jgi:hypothetical protein
MTRSATQKSELMRQALTLWQKVTGCDPNAHGSTIGSWRVAETFKQVQEAIELDPTELTATLLLTHFTNEYLNGRLVSYATLVRDPDSVVEHLGLCRELLSILDRPEIVDSRIEFTENLLVALGQYDAAERDDVKKLLAEPDNLAILRRDALRSIKELRVDQFLDGSPEPEGISPVYAKVVHQWWNVNSMLQAAPRIPSGVSLNLIRDPSGYQSYFAFLIRNGANVFVLSDVPEFAHPLQPYMSRKPERDLDRRAARNWFPYDLLGIAYDEESGDLYFKESQERGLVAYQNDALPLRPVAEIGAAEVVWLSMMFDLIVDKFWHQEYKAPTLSYTAEMLKNNRILIESANDSNLPVPTYVDLGLQPLALSDVSAEQVSEEAIGKKYDGVNDWMEKRYGARVPVEILNLVAAPDKALMIEKATGALVAQPNAKVWQSQFDKERIAELNTLVNTVNATTFGTKEKLQQDRLFIARCNYADAINTLAEQEYKERKTEVEKWFHDRLDANMENILKWAGNEEVFVDDGVKSIFSRYHLAGQCYEIERADGRHVYRSVINRLDVDADTHIGRYARYRGPWLGNGPGCVIHHNKASFAVVFSPANAAELAWLAGCKIEDLPDILQHWSQLDGYRGNYILDRIDPMLWRAHNPWRDLDLRFKLAFSKRGIAQVIKHAELPALPNRLDTHPKSL